MSFYDDLKFGQDAERLLLLKYDFLEPTTGRTSDLKIKGTEIHIELKSDSYCPKKYINFIMERYSKDEVDGGPFSALKNGCRYFIYKFVKDDSIYIFKTVRLVARIKKLVKKHDLQLHSFKNASWTTRYYKIPRELFLDLLVSENELRRLYEQSIKKNRPRTPKISRAKPRIGL